MQALFTKYEGHQAYFCMTLTRLDVVQKVYSVLQMGQLDTSTSKFNLYMWYVSVERYSNSLLLPVSCGTDTELDRDFQPYIVSNARHLPCNFKTIYL